MKLPFSHRRGRDAAAALEAVAADWVLRHDEGLDPAGQGELAQWLAADPAHAKAFSRMSGTWDAFQRDDREGSTEEIASHLALRSRRRQVARRCWILASSAAAIALAFLWRLDSPAGPTVERAPVAALGFEPVRKLPDGTLVELNQGAEIAVQFEPGVRRIQLLRGEALFRVQKDPARPFVVRAGAIEVQAVGTSFNVEFQPQVVEVLVTEGKVRVCDAASGASLLPVTLAGNLPARDVEHESLLVAGQRARVDSVRPARLAPNAVATLAPAEIDVRLAWLIPQFKFAGTELAEAARLFNRHNRLQLSFEDASIGSLRVSGTFRADNPEAFVRLVEATFGLRADRSAVDAVVLVR